MLVLSIIVYYSYVVILRRFKYEDIVALVIVNYNKFSSRNSITTLLDTEYGNKL